MSSKKSPKAGKGDFRKLLAFIGEYKKATVLTPLFMVGEVAMEVTIPYTMAKIIDNILAVALRDSAYGAICCTCTASDAIVSDYVCHCDYPPL